MKRRLPICIGLLAAALTAFIWSTPAVAAPAAPERLRVPKGFQIEVLTDAVPNARGLALGRFTGDRGAIYVGSMREGKVYAVELDGGRALRVHTLASGLTLPTGVAYRDGSLFVSAVSRILRFDGIDERLANPPAPKVVTDRLPGETHHGAKFLAFGPDGLLYYAVGAPCNVCVPSAAHGNIQRFNPEGGGSSEVIARGVRNSVGLAWNPRAAKLWFTDNGRDMLGDDLPADELNRIDTVGQHFGFPYCHQGDTPDPDVAGPRRCGEFVRQLPSSAPMSPRWACVSTPARVPAEYRNNIFVAQHGSWNRSRRNGYQVLRVVLDAQGQVLRQEPFVEGWLQLDMVGRETVLGRPADVLVLPDGSLLVSDDHGGAIYRVRYAP